MTTLLFRFPAGRYHATPWGHHVNEGLVEWPPSPWRIVRALLACGYATQGWREGNLPAEARELVAALASCLPSYHLPPASIAHSRHYMPLGELDKGREKTTLVIDAWARVEGPLVVTWPVRLAAQPSGLLAQLARNLGYLGRSESWVEAEYLESPPPELGPNCFPQSEIPSPKAAEGELVRVLCLEPPESYLSWRQQEVAQTLAAAGKGTRAKERATAPFPDDLMACLHRDTAENQAFGWSQPPGSRQVLYRRPEDALHCTWPRIRRPSGQPPVEAILLSLATATRNAHALPHVHRTLPQAELLHRGLVACAARIDDAPCPVLTGLDEQRAPLRDHRHVHILPLDLDNDRHIDHILLHAGMLFDDRARKAVQALRRTFAKGGIGDLQVTVAAEAQLTELARLPAPYGPRLTSLLGPARIWSSLTPFVPPRHQKRRGRNTLVGQIEAEVASRGLPAAAIEILPVDTSNQDLRHFVRRRRPGSPQPPSDAGFDLRLTFARPVAGPISLGYGSHFGLGLFGAAQDGPS